MGLEDSGAESNVNCGGPSQEDSEGKNIIDCYCDILARYETAFCPCSKNLPEAKLQGFGPMSLTEEISRQPSIC